MLPCRLVGFRNEAIVCPAVAVAQVERFVTAAGRGMRTPIYIGIGMLEGTGFVNGVVPTAVPLVGYKLLQDLGFKVDLVNERVEPRPDGEIGPPFLLWAS